MKGFITKIDDNWVIKFSKHPTSNKIYDNDTLPLHPDDVDMIKNYELVFDNIEARINSQPEVEFLIVDEFTHPELFKNVGWGDGQECAKLI